MEHETSIVFILMILTLLIAGGAYFYPVTKVVTVVDVAHCIVDLNDSITYDFSDDGWSVEFNLTDVKAGEVINLSVGVPSGISR